MNDKHLPARWIDRHARVWMSLVLVISDAAGLFLAGVLGFTIRYLITDLVNPPFYWNLLGMIPIFLVIYALRGLYPGVGLSPVEELRRLSTATSAVFLVFTAFTFWIRIAEYFSRLIIAFSWGIALVTVPLSRWIFRTILVNLDMWGEPVAVIGDGPQTYRVVDFLLTRMRFGLRPVVILNADKHYDDSSPIPEVPLNMAFDKSNYLPSLRTAILIDAELPAATKDQFLYESIPNFQRFIMISDQDWIGSLGVDPYDLEGLLGLELRQNLLNPWHRRTKRAMDLVLSTIIGVISLPVCGFIAVSIKIDSPGHVLFCQERVGKNGDIIRVWKFRTMVNNADELLKEYLDEHPVAQIEWRENQKLKNDPRVTRTGRFLRRTSLDEIPQLWNVLKGEMSLVGPRPIVKVEIERYKAGYRLYTRVRPGITGLWQASRRKDTSYSDRVRYDEYYVRNWSIWLDIYIMLRTVWVVISGQGAH